MVQSEAIAVAEMENDFAQPVESLQQFNTPAILGFDTARFDFLQAVVFLLQTLNVPLGKVLGEFFGLIWMDSVGQGKQYVFSRSSEFKSRFTSMLNEGPRYADANRPPDVSNGAVFGRNFGLDGIQ